MSPLVVSIVPCHNHEKWVGGALLSIDAQDYDRKEIVLVDDGSTDDSLRAALRECIDPRRVGPVAWQAKLPNGTPLKAIRGEVARGPSWARNQGAALAPEADYFAFLDSDDVFEQEKLSQSIAAFDSYPNIVAVYTDYDTVRSDGVRIREFKPPFSRRALLESCIVNCDSVVLASAFRVLGGFDETFRVAEDYQFWIMLSENYTIHHIPSSLLTLRVGDHSSTATVPNQTWVDCHRRLYQGVAERAKRRQSG